MSGWPPRAAAIGLILLFPPPGAVAQGDALLDPLGDTPAAPALSLPRVDGSRFDLEALQGSVVVVNFWATWCPPCRKEMPSLQRLHRALAGENFTVIAVDVGETREEVQRFVDTLETPLDFPLLLDGDGAATRQWPVVGLPTTYVVSRDGRLTWQALGERDWSSPAMMDRMEAIIEGREVARPGAAALAAAGVLLAGLGIAGGLLWRRRS